MRGSGKMTTVAVESVKCACPDCVCVVKVSEAVKKNGRAYCCDECAAGHPNGAGCEHAGCPCHG